MWNGSLQPEVNEDLCVGCGVCVNACPTGAIEIDRKARIDYTTCTGCGRCVQVCSQGAVKMSSVSDTESGSLGEGSEDQKSDQLKLKALRNRVEALDDALDEVKKEIGKLKETGKV